MAANDLERETTDVLRELVRFNTVNPPGNERAAIEFLARYLSDAGLKTELLADDEDRPNLVADLTGGDGRRPHPVLPRPRRHGPRRPLGVDARSVVRRGRRRLPLGPRRARHEVPGGRRGGRRRHLGPRRVATGARHAEARVRLRRGDRRRRRRPLADRQPIPTASAATCCSTRAAARCSSGTATAATACAAPRRGSSASS